VLANGLKIWSTCGLHRAG